jgi:hypothetical protein
VKQGDLEGSLEARSEGLQASDFSRAMVPGLAAVISCNSSAQDFKEQVWMTYKNDDPTIIASLGDLSQSILHPTLPLHLSS